MTTRKIVKSTAIGATLLTSLLGAAIGYAATGPEWLAEQVALSDGSAYFVQEGTGGQGPAGRPAVARGSERDAFLETQLAMTDGSPYRAEHGAAQGPEGKRAQFSAEHGASFVEHQVRITDGSPE
jgi:hypothetical protein